MQIYDFVMAGIMYLISGVMFWQIRDFDTADSRALPTAIAVILIVLATSLILSRLFKKNTKDTYDFKNTPKGLLILLLLLAFTLCSYWFGFYVSTPFFVFAAMLVLGQRNKLFLALVPILSTAVILILFRFMFQVNLPEGTIFNIFNLF